MFSFFGSKWLLAKRYGAPKFPVVIEPFAGSAAYSLYWNVERAFLTDVDEIICGVWSFLIRATEREILSLPLDFEHTDNLCVCQEAKWLIGFWIKKGGSVPGLSRTVWARQYRESGDCKVWSEAVRERIAKQLPSIRRWRVKQASYADLPDVEGTWFIDPPYSVAGKHYRRSEIDYGALGTWCRQRKGQVFVCENAGSIWLPFEKLHEARSTFGKHRSGKSVEMVYRT